ncbi:MAG: autotransporter outer membrane beta-barrel domain-containing protein, partial [Gammaproteobacteria bacterium]|nr:autotransporter outer membrane beta-barrel domain-containing protein [Gammaproteobacteria bacterium]
MNKAKLRLYVYVFVVASSFYSISANAQLDTFVNNPDNGASDLQRETANAVQRTCGALAGLGGFQLTGEQGDLFARCNEMVSTAAELQGDTGRTRSLMLSETELLAAVQQVSGEELHAQNTLSTRVTNGQFSNIAGRLNAVRIGGNSAALGGRVAATGTYDDPSRNAPGYRDLSLGSRAMTGGGAAGDEDMAGSRWGWFLEGSFNTGDRDQTASEDGFDFDSTSVTLGIDYLLDNGVIGASVGIDNYEADFNPTLLVSGGNVEVEGTTGAIFGALFRDNWYFDGILSFGSLDSDTNRDAFYISNNPACLPVPCPGVNTTLSGETDGDFVAAGLSVGYDYTNGNWDISPQLSLAYRDVSLDGYVESDSL